MASNCHFFRLHNSPLSFSMSYGVWSKHYMECKLLSPHATLFIIHEHCCKPYLKPNPSALHSRSGVRTHYLAFLSLSGALKHACFSSDTLLLLLKAFFLHQTTTQALKPKSRMVSSNVCPPDFIPLHLIMIICTSLQISWFLGERHFTQLCNSSK